MATISDFINEVLLEAPACPLPVAKNAILNTIADFCEKSTLWREEADPISVIKNEAVYDLEPPRDTLVTEIIWMGYNKKELLRRTEAQLAAANDKWMTDKGTPEAYMHLSSQTFRLYRVPSVALTDGITLRMALKPTPTATTVLQDIYDDWHETIAFGAQARLLAMRGKPWSDNAAAGQKLLGFASGVAEARRTATASHHGRVSRSVRYGGI